MCGIYATTFPVTDQSIATKLKAIKFRGPDYSNFVRIDNCVLGHNRLSIIDLDARSNQPFEYSGYTIVFNGEIYNFKELKDDLVRKNYVFETNSDTEVLIASYIEYGISCLSQFNGMFAFVIHDKRKHQLIFARDRLGKKPLYYRYDNADIEIASQIKQLTLGNTISLDDEAVKAFFKYKYIPAPRSIYNEIVKLPAASVATFDLIQGSLEIKQFWDLPSKILYTKSSYGEAKSSLKDLLRSAVDLRLIADVPVGIFLSGGIDSSLVASIAQEVNEEPVNTFCVKFNDKEFDESVVAERVAKHIGSHHTTIECKTQDVLDSIESLIDCFDEPFADSSALPSILLSRVAKKHIKVALTGDGADEVFLGYNRYDIVNRARLFYSIPVEIRKIFGSCYRIISNPRLLKYLDQFQVENISYFYHRLMQGFDQEYFQGEQDLIQTDYFDYMDRTDKPIEKAGLYDLKTYLADDINVKVDRASMMASLEARAPFLDYRIVEFGTSLPEGYRYKKGYKKRILRDIAAEYIPSEILNRPKSGFTIPLADWFRGDLKDFVLDNLTPINLKNIPNIDVKKVEILVNSHMQGVVNKQNEIWKLLVFIMWSNKR